jgi:hypothetical protein
MGISTTSVRSLARSLEKKKYLHREGKPGSSNRYHLNRLFESLEAFDEQSVRTHRAPKGDDVGRSSSRTAESSVSSSESLADIGRDIAF